MGPKDFSPPPEQALASAGRWLLCRVMDDELSSTTTAVTEAEEEIDALSAAIAGDDLQGISDAVAAGADVNAVDQYGCTPLDFAMYINASTETLRALIAAGVELHPSCGRLSPLMCALRYGNASAVSALLEAGANPNFNTNPNDSTSILREACCWPEATRVLPMLFAHGLRVHDEEYVTAHPHHATPLHSVLIWLDAARANLRKWERDVIRGVFVSPSTIAKAREHVEQRAGTVGMLFSYGQRLPPPAEPRSLDDATESAAMLARRCFDVLHPVLQREAWTRRRAAVSARRWRVC